MKGNSAGSFAVSLEILGADASKYALATSSVAVNTYNSNTSFVVLSVNSIIINIYL